jgi:hypothetical protein
LLLGETALIQSSAQRKGLQLRPPR